MPDVQACRHRAQSSGHGGAQGADRGHGQQRELEHPNIVPVHELGLDAKKRLFFTMKMVRGRSLEQILKAQNEPGDTAADFTLARLLNVFVGICNGLSFAHSRNVIHRDLKPANIMIGDYGEVYVMDWGLAKVLGERAPARKSTKETLAPKSAVATSSGSMVSTNRTHDGDLTQDGAIMGTPAYMPPEQALGDIEHIDQRSDIYSLGAILYAILTLQAPIEKGNPTDMLLRVVDGAIKPPEVRAPNRVIPPELSAIAMKALAKDRANRYATVEAMRRDVELFLEGRSVSAKQDSFREQAWKLVKRNKGVSLATAASLLVLAVVLSIAFRVNIAARLDAEEHQRQAVGEKNKAEKAYASYQSEQEAKEKLIRQSIPAMVRASQQLANEGRTPDAMAQVELAITYEPKHAEARLLKAQILCSQKEWLASLEQLGVCLEAQPENEAARELRAKIGEAGPQDTVALHALAELIQQQQLPGLSIPLLADVTRDVEKRKPIVAIYRKQIAAKWPGLEGGLTLEKDGRIVLNLARKKQITDLSPLLGIQLDELNIEECPVTDLRPLAGMPLRSLYLMKCKQIEDFTPLKGLRLSRLFLSDTKISNLEPLKGMPLEILSLQYCSAVNSLEVLRGMPLRKLNLAKCHLILTLSPLEGMPLEDLTLMGCRQLTDLTPLKGMPLKQLHVGGSGPSMKYTDLGPLQGMPLESLDINNTRVEDISPLEGMPLKFLVISDSNVVDLTPLRDMELRTIRLIPKKIRRGIEILREMKSIVSIGSYQNMVAPEEFWRRYDAGEFNK